ncbi:bifunctional metallophosphatase/5'-nucleotidase [bacterium]|jgi:5'-nucleotidase|nr:bifunctional metallophosphatase/5'-nucleotidase [bacterium]
MKALKSLYPVLVLFTLLASVGCTKATKVAGTAEPLKPSTKTKSFTLLATTDFHGALLPETVTTAAGEKVEYAGAALLSSYVKIAKSKVSGPVFIIDAGDMFQGSLESNLAEGAPVVQFYNYLGVSAAALGNHEFDYGPVGPDSIPLHPDQDPRGALKARVQEAKFPILGANVGEEPSDETPSWLKRSVVIEQDGIRVGVIGIATPSTPTTTTRANVVGLKFHAPLTPVLKEVKRLREEEKADFIVATFHGGGGCFINWVSKLEDLSSCDDQGEAFELAKKLPAGAIDVIVAGHTHKGVLKKVNGIPIIQPFSHGKYMGWVDVKLAAETDNHPRALLGTSVRGLVQICGGVMKDKNGFDTCDPKSLAKYADKVLPATFLGMPVQPDAEVVKLLEPAIASVKPIRDRPVGKVEFTDSIKRSYGSESAMGNLVADAIRESVPGLDLATTNGGGLRADFPAGKLTYGDIYESIPFDNQLAIVTATGDQVYKMISVGVSGNHGALSWSGLSVTLGEVGENPCRISEVLVNGQPLDPTKTYRVGTSDYLATGGSGFDSVKLTDSQIEVLRDQDRIIREVVFASMSKWTKTFTSTDFLDPAKPRIVFKDTCKKKD